MAQLFKYEATFSDGTVDTRGSNRKYTHAALNHANYPGYPTNEWVTYHGTEALARKGKFVVEVVEVAEVKASKKVLKATATEPIGEL